MSWHEYEISKSIDRLDPPFYALIMSAMRKADPLNLAALQQVWPSVWDELDARYNAPGGFLEGELPDGHS